MELHINSKAMDLIASKQPGQVVAVIQNHEWISIELRMARPIYTAQDGSQKMQVCYGGAVTYCELHQIKFVCENESVICPAVISQRARNRFRLPFPLSEEFGRAEREWKKACLDFKLHGLDRKLLGTHFGWVGKGAKGAELVLRAAINSLEHKPGAGVWEDVRFNLESKVIIPSSAPGIEAERLEAERLEAERLAAEIERAKFRDACKAEDWLMVQFDIERLEARGLNPGRE